MLKNWGLTSSYNENYVLHNLQLYLRLGLKQKKIHRVLEFNQSQWLKPHVEFNKQKIIEAEKKWKRWKTKMVTKMKKLCTS